MIRVLPVCAWWFRCCRDCHQKHRIWCLTHERSTAASQSGLLLRVLGLVCRPVQIAYLFVERHSILSHCSDRTYKSHVLLWNVHKSCMCLLMAKRNVCNHTVTSSDKSGMCCEGSRPMTRTPKRELNSCRPRTTLIRGLTDDRLQRFTPRDPFTVSFSRVRKKRCGPTWKARSSEREKGLKESYRSQETPRAEG